MPRLSTAKPKPAKRRIEPPSHRKVPYFFLIALVISLGFLAFDTVWRVREIQKATAIGQSVLSPSEIVVSPTNRQIVLPSAAMDARWWMIHTEEMQRHGWWRIHHSEHDNYPAGRDIHWSSLPMWLLSGLGAMTQLATGLSKQASLEWAAAVFGPFTLLLTVVPLSVLLFRRYGGLVAGMFCLIMVTAFPLYQSFRAGDADHHGLVAACGLASVLFILLGYWDATGERKNAQDLGRAERKFLVSAILGATGLWISAASLIPILAGLAVGAMVISFVGRKYREARLDSRVWTLWGVAGGAFSLLYYLLEYFPNHLGMRLEVNHPLYALAWMASGYLLTRVTRWISGESKLREGKWSDGLAALSLVMAGSPAILIVAAGDRFFKVSNRFVYDLHRYYIREIQSFAEFAGPGGLWTSALAFLAIPSVILAGSALVLLSKQPPVKAKAGLLLALAPALLLQALAISQVRWSGNAMALWVVVLIAVLVILSAEYWKNAGAKWTWFCVLGGTMLLYPKESLTLGMQVFSNPSAFDGEYIPSLICRDVARQINLSEPGLSPVILSGPSASTELAFFGGGNVLGTLYWENGAGLEASARIYSATKDEDFKKLLIQNRVTHIVIFSWDSFAQSYVRLWRGLGKTTVAKDGCLAGYLEGTRPQPIWLRPLYYPNSTERPQVWARIYRFVPDQTPSEWHYYVGQYQMDAGKPEMAVGSFKKAQALNPKNNAASAELVRALFISNRETEAKQHLDAILADPRFKQPELLEKAAEELQTAKGNPTYADALTQAAKSLRQRQATAQ